MICSKFVSLQNPKESDKFKSWFFELFNGSISLTAKYYIQTHLTQKYNLHILSTNPSLLAVVVSGPFHLVNGDLEVAHRAT